MNFVLHIGSPTGEVVRHGFFEIQKARIGVVEIRNGLYECFARVIGKRLLKRAERRARVIKDLFAVNNVAGINIADMAVATPTTAGAVLGIVFAVGGRQKVERFALDIAAACGDFFL